jgi:hypothetical protein
MTISVANDTRTIMGKQTNQTGGGNDPQKVLLEQLG